MQGILAVLLLLAGTGFTARLATYPEGDDNPHFFEYGPGAGDIPLCMADDGTSVEVEISTTFRIFTDNTESLWVRLHTNILIET